MEAVKRHLLFACFEDEYTFYIWLTLELEENLLRFGNELYQLWHDTQNIFWLIID